MGHAGIAQNDPVTCHARQQAPPKQTLATYLFVT